MIADGQPLTEESTEQAMSRYATATATDYADTSRSEIPNSPWCFSQHHGFYRAFCSVATFCSTLFVHR